MYAELQKMLEAEVIVEVGASEWVSPVLMVRKADGTWRFCVDYRLLNDRTKPWWHPTPDMNQLINCMATAFFKTSIDLNSGYWQIGVRPGDKEKLTFICPMGLYTWNRMPFGAKNAGATFQYAMDKILEGYQWKRAPTYIDNIGIWSKKGEDHVKIVDEVLTLFENAGATLNAKKCEFGCRKISYLGLVVDIDGVYLSADRVKAIVEYPEPKNAQEMLRFLGMASWCRRFIQNFSQIAAPLYGMTKKTQPFMWTDRARLAFGKLKQAMSEVGVMKLFEFGKPLVVRTDASKEGVGAVLLQRDDEGVLRVIEYASEKSNMAQARWTAERMEAYAIVWALKRWRDYLLGGRFTLQTDNRALI